MSFSQSPSAAADMALSQLCLRRMIEDQRAFKLKQQQGVKAAERAFAQQVVRIDKTLRQEGAASSSSSGIRIHPIRPSHPQPQPPFIPRPKRRNAIDMGTPSLRGPSKLRRQSSSMARICLWRDEVVRLESQESVTSRRASTDELKATLQRMESTLEEEEIDEEEVDAMLREEEESSEDEEEEERHAFRR